MIPLVCFLGMRKKISEQSVEYVDGYAFFDFQKACYGQVEVELDGCARDLVEIVLGEYAENGGIVHKPGWRTFKIDDFRISPEQKVYRMNIPTHRGAYGALPHIETPEEFGGEVAVFRYVEINHYYGPAKVRRIEFYNDAPEDAAHFQSSDMKLDKIWEFCKHSLLATSIFPCYVDGERERMPYEGDAYIAELGHYCCGADYSIAERTIDYFMANGDRTWPTEWILLTPQLAYYFYLYSGNRDALDRWLSMLPEKVLPHFFRENGLLCPKPPVRDIVDWPEKSRDGYEFGEANFVPNAYCHGSLRILAQLTGDQGFDRKADMLKARLRESMLKNGVFVDNPDSCHTSLHTAMFALRFGLVDGEAEVASCSEIIRKKGMACSVYAAQFLLETCFGAGLDDLGMEFLTSDGLRSWFNMLRCGSTITMEAWDESEKPHQDWSHPWGAAPANIIPRHVVGLRPVAPGFSRFVVKPSPASPQEFFLRQPTPFGAIEVQKKGEKVEVSLKGDGRRLVETSPGEWLLQ